MLLCFAQESSWFLFLRCRFILHTVVSSLLLVAFLSRLTIRSGSVTPEKSWDLTKLRAWRSHLPPKACYRSCRWSAGSWHLARCHTADRSQGFWSPLPGSCYRRAGESGWNQAWRICKINIKRRCYSGDLERVRGEQCMGLQSVAAMFGGHGEFWEVRGGFRCRRDRSLTCCLSVMGLTQKINNYLHQVLGTSPLIQPIIKLFRIAGGVF